MGRFAKDAPWIRRIFTPSTTPAVVQPFAVSEDVQLTQDYLAFGQTQQARLWLLNTQVLNPGPNNLVGLVVPLPVEDEMWRVFFVSIDMPSLSANFGFELHLRHVESGDLVCVCQRVLIVNGTTQPVCVWPVTTTDTQAAAPVGTDFHMNPTPLILPAPADTTPANGNRITLDLRQTSSAQAAGTEGINVQAYILRNPRGLAHIL